MNKEDKKLLLKDLCARLAFTLDNALDGEHNGLAYASLDVDGEEPKPYLRPMSCITEEEKIYQAFFNHGVVEYP